jgi:hypothetical protein
MASMGSAVMVGGLGGGCGIGLMVDGSLGVGSQVMLVRFGAEIHILGRRGGGCVWQRDVGAVDVCGEARFRCLLAFEDGMEVEVVVLYAKS